MAKRIVVTGGNAGIGFALCKQLAIDHGCHVYLCSRNAEKGAAAVKAITDAAPAGCAGKVELITLAADSDDSVRAAAATVKAGLGDATLYAVVNNAGTGLQHGVGPEFVVNVNLHGPKRVLDAFLPLLAQDGRVVNVGSGAGPSFVKNASAAPDVQKFLCSTPPSWESIEALAKAQLGKPYDTMGGYGVSKACLSAWTMLLAAQPPPSHPKLLVSCCSPGFIDTAMTKGWGASKPPEEGTLAIKKLLFEELEGNGWYYGSDGVRSPYHFMRNPGEPAYDGTPPF